MYLKEHRAKYEGGADWNLSSLGEVQVSSNQSMDAL